MSQLDSRTIACPQCGHEQECQLWASINVTLDPSLKQDLLDNRLNRFTCAACGYEAQVAASFLYHDMGQKLMIAVNADHEAAAKSLTEALTMSRGVQQAFAGYQFRSVATRDDLVDKVLVLDAGLDDAIVEMVKVATQQNDDTLRHARLYFNGWVEQPEGKALSFAAIAARRLTNFTVPEVVYDEFARRFGELAAKVRQAEQVPRIDRDTINALLKD